MRRSVASDVDSEKSCAGSSPRESSGELIADIRPSDLLPRDDSLGDADDNAQLQYLNEANLVANLRCRFIHAFTPVRNETEGAAEERQRRIYTYTGTLLIAVNPYRFFNLYDRRWIGRFSCPCPASPRDATAASAFGSSASASPAGVSSDTTVSRVEACSSQSSRAVLIGAHAAPAAKPELEASRALSRRLVPHPFALAEFAYCRLVRDKKSQSILISGESGAGKTETSKHVLTYLAAVSDQRHGADSQGLEARLLQSGPVLEAFGNAHTVLNVNSSRFGKMLMLHFTDRGKLTRASVLTYLLANERVVRMPVDEFGFHIFYALCNAAARVAASVEPAPDAGEEDPREEGMHALLRSLHLDGGVERFRLLNTGAPRAHGDSCTDAHSRQDAVTSPLSPWADLRRITDAMHTVGIDDNVRADIFKLLAAILHLGNVTFTEQDERCKRSKLSAAASEGERPNAEREQSCDQKEASLATGVRVTPSSRENIRVAARLLGLPSGVEGEEMLRLALVSRSVRETRSFFDLEGAQAARDAACKTLYSRAFDAVVARINAGLQRSASSSQDSSPGAASGNGTRTIGILDIFGFEDLRNHSNNRLEQLCINYANERLHCFLLQQLILNEHVLYTQEGIFTEKNCSAFPFSLPLASPLPASSPAAASPFSASRVSSRVSFPSLRSAAACSVSPSLPSFPSSFPSSVAATPPLLEGRRPVKVSDLCGVQGALSNGEKLTQTSSVLCTLLAGSALTGDLRCLLPEDERGEAPQKAKKFSVAPVASLVKTAGVFGILEEAGRLPAKGDRDVLFCNRLLAEMKSKGAESFIRGTKTAAQPREGCLQFTVSHFACDVTYDARDFCRSNRDATSDELERLFHACTTYTRLAAVHAKAPGGHGAGGCVGRRGTVSVHFAAQLQQVVKALQETPCHFIRCVKPNRRQQPGVFEEPYVHTQLRCSGMTDLLHVMADGFPCRLPYADLWRRYEARLPRELREALTPRDFASLVLEALRLPSGAYRLGSSRVFFRLGCLDTVDELLRKKVSKRSLPSGEESPATSARPVPDGEDQLANSSDALCALDAYSLDLVTAVLTANARRKRRRLLRHVRIGARLRLSFAKKRASHVAVCCAVRVLRSLHPRQEISAAVSGLVAAFRAAAGAREKKLNARAVAATRLAAFFRGCLARDTARRLREEKHLQREEEKVMQRREEAAVVLQSVWRGLLTRRTLKAQHAAAVAIQRHWWGFRNRRGKHFFFLQLHKLQRATRRWLIRKRWRERRERVKTEAERREGRASRAPSDAYRSAELLFESSGVAPASDETEFSLFSAREAPPAVELSPEGPEREASGGQGQMPPSQESQKPRASSPSHSLPSSSTLSLSPGLSSPSTSPASSGAFSASFRCCELASSQSAEGRRTTSSQETKARKERKDERQLSLPSAVSSRASGQATSTWGAEALEKRPRGREELDFEGEERVLPGHASPRSPRLTFPTSSLRGSAGWERSAERKAFVEKQEDAALRPAAGAEASGLATRGGKAKEETQQTGCTRASSKARAANTARDVAPSVAENQESRIPKPGHRQPTRSEADIVSERGALLRAALSSSSEPLGTSGRRLPSSSAAGMRLHAASSPAACGAFAASDRLEGERERDSVVARVTRAPSVCPSGRRRDAAPSHAARTVPPRRDNDRQRGGENEKGEAPLPGRAKREREPEEQKDHADVQSQKATPDSWGETAFLPSSEGEEETGEDTQASTAKAAAGADGEPRGTDSPSAGFFDTPEAKQIDGSPVAQEPATGKICAAFTAASAGVDSGAGEARAQVFGDVNDLSSDSLTGAGLVFAGRRAPLVCETKIPSPSLFVAAMKQKRRKVTDVPAAQ
ncbi:putative myosin head motor domain-containing protein [Neospora caninum Liverpool]|uniref:Putative myosin head motor domain-containing protein n=1 Tax=Neospora caninum (strain Liverpool) TaxID=572307 RepID=F0VAX6_NEOCL|nr:putative myosin head motor domain-containing protein [Neospora caninum Liverpool]CBZ51352.1 putative myosin head motor domain-containing protein [Neospora caninum Liverpool]|eukprot:XP_003881385.1 putative myosin head motor domain-containing protein [Neospora caninum Liverpool]